MKRLLLLGVIGCAPTAQIPADPPHPVSITEPAGAPPAAPELDDAQVVAKSHEFLESIDHADAAAFEGMVAPSFVYFEHERYVDAKSITAAIHSQNDRHLPLRSHTWSEERVFRSGNAAVFVGHSIEHAPAEGEHKAADVDGFNTVYWVRSDGAWKVAAAQFSRKMTKGEFWDDAFRGSWGFKTQPNQLLVDTIKGVKPGAALDLATGQGRNSVFLATQGWKTTGVDVSKEGLRQAREQADQKKVKLETVEADMEQWDLGKDKWDLVTMIYCGTSQAVVAKVKPSLKKGGLFVTEYFHADSDAGKSGAGGWHTGELKALFADGFDILRDDVVDDIADWTQRKQKLVRFVARKK